MGATPGFAAWQRLDHWLKAHEPFWSSVPFNEPEPAWAKNHPELYQWLLALDDASLSQFQPAPLALAESLTSWLPDLAAGVELIQMDDLSGESAALPESAASGMPGRKRLQAGALTGSLKPLDRPLVDWCCGAGHLAATLHQASEQSVTGLDWDAALVHKGLAWMQQQGHGVALKQQDVLDPLLVLPQAHHWVALHACGGLHRRLLQQGIAQQAPRLSFSPCCYSLFAETPDWQPLSRQAAQTQLQRPLPWSLLRLAVQQTATAAARQTRQRRRLRAWRLGYFSLYPARFALASAPASLASEDFNAFVAWADAQSARQTPATHRSQAEAQGWQQLARIERLELLRHCFRRPLEIWLVRDYQLALEEAGYITRLGCFCDPQLTPRNLLLDAIKSPSIPCHD